MFTAVSQPIQISLHAPPFRHTWTRSSNFLFFGSIIIAGYNHLAPQIATYTHLNLVERNTKNSLERNSKDSIQPLVNLVLKSRSNSTCYSTIQCYCYFPAGICWYCIFPSGKTGGDLSGNSLKADG